MKRVSIILALALILGAAAYALTYYFSVRPAQEMLTQKEGEMEWLRREFHLTDSQFLKIKEMHNSYRPRCDEMCRRIAESNRKLESLLNTNRVVTPEMEAALKESTTLHYDCQQAMLHHIYDVSQIMNPEQGRRYIDMMKGCVIQPGQPANATVGAQ